jgi:hypothetical protein
MIHLTAGEQARRNVEHTLDELNVREEVVAIENDALSEGPLVDIDGDGSCRVDWYKRISNDARAPNNTDAWRRVEGTSEDVVLWHGPHVNERMFVLRACWHLRARSSGVYEVARERTHGRWGKVEYPAFYDAVALARSDVLRAAWEKRRAIDDDVLARAKRWEELRSEPGDRVRLLQSDDTIVSVPVTAFDERLLATANEWTSSERVIGRVLGKNALGLAFLTWRTRELVRTGRMMARGELNRIGLQAEMRSAS